MRNLAIPAQFVLAAAAIGLGMSLCGLPAADTPRLVLGTPVAPSATKAVDQGEAAPKPVDLDGDGVDDSPFFADAVLTDAEGGAPPETEGALVLRLVPLACPEADPEAPLAAALNAPKPTPWVLIAADSERLPNAAGERLRVVDRPAPAASAEPRPVVIETGGEPADDPAYLRAVAESCKPLATVVS